MNSNHQMNTSAHANKYEKHGGGGRRVKRKKNHTCAYFHLIFLSTTFKRKRNNCIPHLNKALKNWKLSIFVVISWIMYIYILYTVILFWPDWPADDELEKLDEIELISGPLILQAVVRKDLERGDTFFRIFQRNNTFLN